MYVCYHCTRGQKWSSLIGTDTACLLHEQCLALPGTMLLSGKLDTIVIIDKTDIQLTYATKETGEP